MLLAASGCGPRGPSAADLVSRHPDRPAVVHHRGASAVAPENTLAAWRLSVEAGARAAETDVHLTADRAVVAIHDRDLDRTTDGTGPVADRTLAELRALDAGSWFSPAFAGERVPTLGDLLDLAGGRLVACIELKAGLGLEHRVREEIDRRGLRGSVVVFAFEGTRAALAKALMPDVPAVWLVPTRPGEEALPYDPDVVASAALIGVDALGFDHTRIAGGIVQAAHAAGYPVFVYTVDAEADVARVASLGVDVVVTNQPALVEGVVGRR